jgi:uncharacterized membrane protein YqjE
MKKEAIALTLVTLAVFALGVCMLSKLSDCYPRASLAVCIVCLAASIYKLWTVILNNHEDHEDRTY